MAKTKNADDFYEKWSKGHTCFQVHINDRWHLSLMTSDYYGRTYETLLVDTMGRKDTRYIKDSRKFYDDFTEGDYSPFRIVDIDEIPKLIKQAKKYIKKKFGEAV